MKKRYSLLFLLVYFIPFKGTSQCSPTYTADISLTTATATELQEIDKIYETFLDMELGLSESEAIAVDTEEGETFFPLYTQAKLDYDNLNIVVSQDNVSGGTSMSSITDPSKILLRFAQYLKFYPNGSDVDDIKEKGKNLIWLILDKFCNGDFSRDYNGYGFKAFSIPTLFFGDYLNTDLKTKYGYMLEEHSKLNGSTEGFHLLWTSHTPGEEYNTDWLSNIAPTFVLYGTWLGDDEKVQWMKGIKRFYERTLTYTDALADGIKIDGTGFHHWVDYDGYMYAFRSVFNAIYSLDNTSFQINAETYTRIRKKSFIQMMISNDAGIKGIGDAGRNPQIKTVTNDSITVQRLTIAGKNILEIDTKDPVLAGTSNRIWGVPSETSYGGVTPFEEGFIQSNYSHRGIFRKDGWLAHFKGFSNYMWGSELYGTTNRYGRYQSYGNLEIIVPGDLSAENNGYDVGTWNWNHYPGTTTIKLPWEKLAGEKARSDELQQKRFVGALTLKNKEHEILNQTYGTYGMFAMDFQEKEGQGFSTVYSTAEHHNATFTFKKSHFAFSDVIVSLGSGINNDDTSNNTITTLYQRLQNSRDVTVNGATVSSGLQTYSGNNNWVISNANTGYYVVNGGDLKVWKGTEVTPNYNQLTSDDWSGNEVLPNTYGYIDHGTNPSNQGFEYVVVPQTTSVDMQNLSTQIQGTNKPYTVHQKNSNAHIIEHKADQIWAYALFEANSNISSQSTTGESILKANDKSCLAMYHKLDDDNIILSMTNPDLGFTSRQSTGTSPTVVIRLTLNGSWGVSQAHANATIVSTSIDETIIDFTTQDGLPIELHLAKTVVPLDGVTYVETLTNRAAAIDTWANDDIYVGDNGFTWTMNGKATENYCVSGKDMYNDSNSTTGFMMKSGTISGGISRFSVKCRNKWSAGTDRTIELLINDKVVGANTNKLDNEVYDFTVENIDIEGDITIALRVPSGNAIAIDDISWTTLVVSSDKITQVETLTNRAAATNAWTNETYLGDNDFSWTMKGKATEDNCVSGKDMYNDPNNTTDFIMESGTIPDGISSFSVKCRNKWSGGANRTIELLINGNVVGSNTSNTDNALYDFTVDDINIKGDITIALKVTEGTIAIDDISWVTNPSVTTTTNISTFTATSDNNWSTTANWSTEVLPTATENVLIPEGETINVDITTTEAKNITVRGAVNINAGKALTIHEDLFQGGTFIINSNANATGTLIIKGNSSGDVTYKKYLTTSEDAAKGWHLVSSPVDGQSINTFASSLITSGVKYAVAAYDNSLAHGTRWSYYTSDASNPITSAGNFTINKGYSIKKATTGTLDFTGELNTTNQSIRITDREASGSLDGSRWNLIGNPFTAYLKGNNGSDSFLSANITAENLDPERAGLYLWNGTSYDVKSIDDSDFYIAPGEAFFVYAKSGSEASASFTEAMETHQNSSNLKTSSSYPEIVLNLSNDKTNAITKIRYIENRTLGLDSGSDIGTFSEESNSFSIYTHLLKESKGIDYAIQALPNSNYETTIIPVGVNAKGGETIKFSLNSVNIPTELDILLEDRVTNTFTSLNIENGKYVLSLENDINGIGRFYLHTVPNNKTLTVEDIDNTVEHLSIYTSNESTLRVVGTSQEKIIVKLFSILGKQELEVSFNSNGVYDIPLSGLSKGFYITQLKTSKTTLNKKIILK